jgi:DNA-binding transcriptional regulator YhcF (GntR family)
MTTKPKNQPAAATIAKVQDQLQATPRSTADLANRGNLAPSTVRRCLTALRSEGLAEQNDQGDWHTVKPETQPKAKQPTKATKATKKAATQAAKPGTPPSPLTGLAAKLSSWGLSDALARKDAEVYELIANGDGLTKDQIASKLGARFSDWSIRRLATSTHRGVTHGDPLIEAVGTGKARTYQVAGK